MWLSFNKSAELDMRSTMVVSYLFAFVPGNLFEEPSAKMARTSVTICDMNFTSTGNGLVVIDSLGQLYVYRMSPISDPGNLSLCYCYKLIQRFRVIQPWWLSGIMNSKFK